MTKGATLSQRRHPSPTPRRVSVAASLAAFTVVAAACGGSNGSTNTTTAAPKLTGSITVSAASSLTDAFGQLGTMFQAAHPGTTITFNFGSSGTLATQIHQGAPADVFASAAPANMTTVQQAGDITGTAGDLRPEQPGDRGQAREPARHPLPGRPDQGQRGGHLREQCALRCHRRRGAPKEPGSPSPPPRSRWGQDVDSTLAEVTTGDADAAIVYVTNAKSVGSQGVGIPIPASKNVTTSYPIGVIKWTQDPASGPGLDRLRAGSDRTTGAAGGQLPARPLRSLSWWPPRRGALRPPVCPGGGHRHGGVPGGSPRRVAHQGLVVDPVVGPVQPGGRRCPQTVADLLSVGHRPVPGVRRPAGLGAGPHRLPRTEPGPGPDHPADGPTAGGRRGGAAPRLRPRRVPRSAPL